LQTNTGDLLLSEGNAVIRIVGTNIDNADIFKTVVEALDYNTIKTALQY